MYELRYYEQIPYKNEIISVVEEIQEQINKIEREYIRKACKEKIITMFSEQENLNKEILKNQFKSKIINLENINYVLKYHKGILKIQIYDTNIEEETKEIQITQKAELIVKLNKKIKVWE